jgi:hypothetical protein
MNAASRHTRAAAILRMCLVCLVVVAPLVSAGICSGCESRCLRIGGCCHADEPAAVDAVTTSCCSAPRPTCCGETADSCETGLHEQGEQAESPLSGCSCMLEPRDHRPAAPSSLTFDDHAPVFAILSPTDHVEDAAADVAAACRGHLFHAPARPVRVLFGVWRN